MELSGNNYSLITWAYSHPTTQNSPDTLKNRSFGAATGVRNCFYINYCPLPASTGTGFLALKMMTGMLRV